MLNYFFVHLFFEKKYFFINNIQFLKMLKKKYYHDLLLFLKFFQILLLKYIPENHDIKEILINELPQYEEERIYLKK